MPASAEAMRDIDQLGGFGTKLIPLLMRAAMGGPVERDDRIACTKVTIVAATKDASLTVPATWFATP